MHAEIQMIVGFPRKGFLGQRHPPQAAVNIVLSCVNSLSCKALGIADSSSGSCHGKLYHKWVSPNVDGLLQQFKLTCSSENLE